MTAATSLGLALLGALLLLFRIVQVGNRPKNAPPGPPTTPFLGNLLQMPQRDLHKKLQEWAQEYGPVYSLILGSTTIIVLSSGTAVKDLIDKRSGIYNERGVHFVAHELLSGGERMLLMPNGPKWRLQRKLMQKMLNEGTIRAYLPYSILENKQMLYDMLQTPDAFIYHIKRFANSLTTTMTYGWRTPTYDNPNMRAFLDGMEEFTNILQNSSVSMADVYPILRWLPARMLPTWRKAKEFHKKETQFYLSLWNRAKEEAVRGNLKPCFAGDLIHAQRKEHFADKFAAYLAGASLEAGTDTTANTLCGFVQAMVLFPKVQEKAQAELDRVVGERLPTIEDMQDLPYIRCCVKESLRWMPTAILGAAPHAVKEDNEYMGYLIPKGAQVINNVYTINNDPERFPKPRQFDPDRYLNDHQTAAEAARNPDVSKRDHFTFGAGRRLCAGSHLAEQSLFLGISGLLWAFNIRPAIDPATKKEILPDPDRYTQAVVCMPEPYPANITPRSPTKAKLVTAEWKEAMKALDENMEWKYIPEGMKFTIL